MVQCIFNAQIVLYKQNQYIKQYNTFTLYRVDSVTVTNIPNNLKVVTNRKLKSATSRDVNKLITLRFTRLNFFPCPCFQHSLKKYNNNM